MAHFPPYKSKPVSTAQNKIDLVNNNSVNPGHTPVEFSKTSIIDIFFND